MSKANNGPMEAPKTMPTVCSRVLPVAGRLQVPHYNAAQEEVHESAMLTVFSSDLVGNGETPILQFQGRTAAQTRDMRDAYSVFHTVALQCHDAILRSRNFVRNIVSCMGPGRQADAEAAFRQGGDQMDHIKTDVSMLFGELIGAFEKRKPPRQAARSAIYADQDLLFQMADGLSGDGDYNDEEWDKIRSLLEHHRVVARMHCKMYAEVLVDGTPHPDGSVAPEEAVGVRFSFWLINNINDRLSGGHALLSFDSGVQAMIVTNQLRRDKERKQQLDKQQTGKRGRDDDKEIVRMSSELKYCMYNDLFRNTYPRIYGLSSQVAQDMRSDVFRSEFTVAPGHSQIASSRAVLRQIESVSEKPLKMLVTPHSAGATVYRKVSCRFKDHFGANLAILKKHRSIQPEQQDPLSYMRSEGVSGLDSILQQTISLARIFTDPDHGVQVRADGERVCTEFRRSLLTVLGASQSQLDMLGFDCKEATSLMADLRLRDPELHGRVEVLAVRQPWRERLPSDLSAGLAGHTVLNEWYSPARTTGSVRSDAVCFKTLLSKLSAHSRAKSVHQLKRIGELRDLMTCLNNQQDREQIEQVRTELAANEALHVDNYQPCTILKSMISDSPDFEELKRGLHCDSGCMPLKVLQNCFFEIHVAESFPNGDGRFVDAERRGFFLREFKAIVRSTHRSRTNRDVFAGSGCVGSGMASSIHGSLLTDQVPMLGEHDIVHTEETRPDIDLHIITDLTKSSPLSTWGNECSKEYQAWLTRFTAEGIEGYTDSFSGMLMNFLDVLFNEVYTRDDMCARSCALREGAIQAGVFGSLQNGTLRRIKLSAVHDVTMEASVNAKQILMHVYGCGYRQGFTHRASLQFTMVVLTSGDPTIGEGTGRRQPVHGNILGSKGLGKSMIEDMLLDLFFKGYVVRKGKATAAAHRTLSKRQSLHCGADLMDEGNTDDRVSLKKGDNSETGNDQAESKKERLSSGEIRSTMAYPVQLPTGESAIATHEMISLCRNICIWARNDNLSQLLAPLADRCVNWQLKRVVTDIDPDEFAADEPVHNSDEHCYQQGVRSTGQTLVAHTLTLMNLFGALSGFAKCIPGVDVGAISFMRSPIARVLERNGQSRFPPRMTSKVIEMMKVSSMLGVALETFWDTWGLFSEKAVRMVGGPMSEFTVKDLVRDPQLPIVGMMYCDFQDALSAYVQLLNQDRIDEVNAIRDAFIQLVKSARLDFWDLFGNKHKGPGDIYHCDLNILKIPVDRQSARADRQTMYCLANKLKNCNGTVTGSGPLESYSIEQIIGVLSYIIEDERHAYQRHPDTLDVLLVERSTKSGSEPRGMPCENVGFTVRSLQEYNRMLRMLDESGSYQNKSYQHDSFVVTHDKLNAVGKEWATHQHSVDDDSPGRFYFPNAMCPVEDDEHCLCDYISNCMIDVKTLDVSTASSHGYVGVSTHWLFEGMRRKHNSKLSDVSLQQQIVEEVAHSATNSGFYATQGIGMSNIKSGAPQCQDIFYVGFKPRDCTIQNTNFVSGHNHRMYGESNGQLPPGMQHASKSLEPLVPDSLQDGMRAWENMMRSLPTVIVSEHFMLHCDKRARLIIAPFMLAEAQRLYENWCHLHKQQTRRVRSEDGTTRQETITYGPVLLQQRDKKGLLAMRRTHLERVLMWMFDTAPEDSEFGYRHLCRHYVHPEDLLGGPDRGRDMHNSMYKDKLFWRFKFWLCDKMMELYEADGEGQLVYKAMNKTTTKAIRDVQTGFVAEFNEIERRRLGPGCRKLTASQICQLPEANGQLEARYDFAQNRLRLKILSKAKEITTYGHRTTALRQQIAKEIGADAHLYGSYLESRLKRNDRPGAHSGRDYLTYLRESSTKYHKQRRVRWPAVAHEYN